MLTPYNFYNWIKEFDSLANASVPERDLQTAQQDQKPDRESLMPASLHTCVQNDLQTLLGRKLTSLPVSAKDLACLV